MSGSSLQLEINCTGSHTKVGQQSNTLSGGGFEDWGILYS